MKRRLFLVLLALGAMLAVAVASGGALDQATLDEPMAVAHASPPPLDTSPDPRTTDSSVVLDDLVEGFVTASLDPDAPPHLGVLLDDAPLPELLVEHLQLPAGQGLVIENVVAGSPADEAGLVRNDLVLELDGKPVTETRAFIEQIQAAHPGDTIELEIVHQGRRDTLTVTLGQRPADDELAWKFPRRTPTASMPGVGLDHGLPPELLERLQQGGFGARLGDLDAFFDQPLLPGTPGAAGLYRESHHRLDDQGRAETVTIQIDGPPDAPDTRIAVTIDADHRSDEYRATVADLDALPEDVRALAREALDNAADNRLRGLSHPLFGNDDIDAAFERRLEDMMRDLQTTPRGRQPS